jgi:type I restriction enzyme S subunit
MKPGYKQTDVGVIPDDWGDELLGDYVRITSGESPSLYRFTISGFPYFKVEQLSNSEKYLDSFSTPYHYERGKTVSRGSVVFAKRGAAIALNRVRVLAQESFMDTNLMALTPTEELDGEFLFYALGHIGLWRFADTTSVPQINNKHVKPLAFPLPKVTEQRAIAEVLNDVDALLEALDRLIAKKCDLKQAAIQQLLTGQTRLPGFHGEWRVKRLGDHIDLLTGFPFPSDQYSDSGVRLLRGSNVKRGETDWSEELVQYWPRLMSALQRYQLQAGDLVIAMDGSLVGRSYARLKESDLPAILLQRVARIRSKTIDIGYLTQIVGSRRFVEYCDSVKTVTAIPHISSADIQNFEITMPPTLPEQTAIADVLSEMDAELLVLEQRREKTRALKQGMMQELLTGRTRLASPKVSHA